MPNKIQTGGSKKPKKTKYVPATSVGGRVTKPNKQQAKRTTRSLIGIATSIAGGGAGTSIAKYGASVPEKVAGVSLGAGVPATLISQKMKKTKTYKAKAKPIKVKPAKSTYQLKKKKG